MATRESEFKTLTEVGTLGRGKSKHRPRNDPDLYGGEYPFVQTGDVKHAPFYLTEYTQTYNAKGLAQSKLWPPGTLCITIAANIADTAILAIPACFPDSILGFTPHPRKADVRYTKYCLDAFRGHMEQISKGTTQDNLSMDKLLKLRFWFPAYELQQKIAALLTAYDDLIANNQRRIALLESMAEEIYREWFVRMRFPGYRASSFDKGLPMGWNSTPLGQLIGETKRPVKKGDLAGHARYVGLEHISRKSVALTMHGKPEAVESDKLAFVAGDILFSKIRPYLHKVALAHFDGICSTDTLVLKPKRQDFREFALFTVFSETFIEIANTASKGTKMPRADLHFLKQLRIPVPNDALLTRFSTMVKPMLDEVAMLIQANEKLATQRDALLPRLISGELRVEALDIQFPPSMQQPPAEAAQPVALSS
ncbi:restriction endonuclease subunit S [Hydrocarboniphaga effusa]|jgi:type I restriction enzyme S subunit|uniref:restriction endonuclease subunit S n=2 Tax=Hydrocarboniphaga effusa TaxID=243629 RepID=UPI003BAC1D30